MPPVKWKIDFSQKKLVGVKNNIQNTDKFDCFATFHIAQSERLALLLTTNKATKYFTNYQNNVPNWPVVLTCQSSHPLFPV
jgi:hypothetical protein